MRMAVEFSNNFSEGVGLRRGPFDIVFPDHRAIHGVVGDRFWADAPWVVTVARRNDNQSKPWEVCVEQQGSPSTFTRGILSYAVCRVIPWEDPEEPPALKEVKRRTIVLEKT